MLYYPQALKIPCGAVARNSIIFGPDGLMYKCPHELGFHDRSQSHVQSVTISGKRSLPVLPTAKLSAGSKQTKGPFDYYSYDPFSAPTCSKCKYLPICLGGCPKTQFEQRQDEIDANKRYWDMSLDPMITAFADSLLEGGMLSQSEAFETRLTQKIEEDFIDLEAMNIQ